MQLLPLQKKAHYVWNSGAYCYSYWQGNYKINLYKLGGYYVQVWQDEEENQVRNVVVQSPTHLSLFHYFSALQLIDLTKNLCVNLSVNDSIKINISF